MNILATDRVLEIGSGNRPYRRSNVLCDLYLDSTFHRQPHSHLIIDRPFVAANADHLPFKTHSFDYTIASHLLEHLDHPAKFLREITRVSSRGYLAFPHPLLERFYKNSPHQWYCVWHNSQLTLIKKYPRHQRLLPTPRQDQKFIQTLRYLHIPLHTQLEWSKTIKYKIFLSPPTNFLSDLDRQIDHYLHLPLKITFYVLVFWKLKDYIFCQQLSMKYIVRQFYINISTKLSPSL